MWDLISLTRDGTHVPCILNHWTTREVPDGVLQDSVTSPVLSQVLRVGLYFSLCEQAGLGHPPTNWAPLMRGPQWVCKRNSRRLQTLRTGLTLLGKQKVGSLVPRWNLEEAKARCLSQASFLTCLPPSPTKGANSNDTYWTPRGPLVLPVSAKCPGHFTNRCLFLGSRNMREPSLSLPGRQCPQNPSTHVHGAEAQRGTKALPRGTQQVGDGESNTFPVYWLGTRFKRRF